MSVTADKKFLRQKYKALRAEMLPEAKKAIDDLIFEKIVSLDEYKRCELLLTYVSTETEVDTFRLLEHTFRCGKTAAVPKSLDKNGNMAFFEIRSFDELEKGYFGIYEPITEKCREISRFDGGICIVPALSYDKDGHRLGYGKGFYDRFLSAHNELLKIGICYSEYMEKHLPCGEYDIPADIVITEKFVEDHRKEKNSDGK